MEFDRKAFGARVRELREEKGAGRLTRETAAEEMHISTDHLRKIEIGERSCSLDLLLTLSEYFQVSTDYLVKGTGADEQEKKYADKQKLKSVIDMLSVIVDDL